MTKARKTERAGLRLALSVFAGCAFGAAAGLASAAGWGGPYIGASIGASSGKTQTGHSLSQPPCQTPATCVSQQQIVTSFTPSLSKSGLTAGVQGGYNWVSGRLVYGLELDANLLGLKTSSTSSGSFVPTGSAGNTRTLTSVDSIDPSWVVTLRPRLGFAMTDRTLIYATAGLALSQVKFTNSTIATLNQSVRANFDSSGSTSHGWVAGFGAEYALSDRTSLKAEYQHLAFRLSPVSGTNTNALVSDLTGATVTATPSRFKADALRIGLNWKF